LEVEIVRGDLLDPVPGSLRGAVDLVVSNPPYIRGQDHEALPEEVRADPYQALVGDTRFHARLAESAPAWLAPGGWLVMEIGADQGEGVRSLLAERFRQVEVLPDLAGRDRVVRGRWPGP
jgi:release factor glutamine methyltransferase